LIWNYCVKYIFLCLCHSWLWDRLVVGTFFHFLFHNLVIINIFKSNINLFWKIENSQFVNMVFKKMLIIKVFILVKQFIFFNCFYISWSLFSKFDLILKKHLFKNRISHNMVQWRTFDCQAYNVKKLDFVGDYFFLYKFQIFLLK